MMITANDPKRESWLAVQTQSDFPIQNIPFGVFITKDDIVTIGTRIGDYAIDLSALQMLGYLKGIELTDDVFLQDNLNDFISSGKKTWRAVRNRIADIFDKVNPTLQNNAKHKEAVIFKIEEVEMQLPVYIGDYTDFYSSREHATNVGKMFRDPANALLPNWLHIPVGYHGRSSTVIPSGINVKRPMGQTLPKGESQPVFGPSKRIDFELETAFITTDANLFGESIPVDEAEDHIFGMVLLNDWSARDIQTWEYVPLGPFLAKNFATSISPWVITLDALEPFRTASPKQEPTPLAYLQQTGDKTFDIHLEVYIQPENGKDTLICQSNFKYLYWTMSQQLAHHTSNGCKINAGDLMGSGTISGPTPNSFGSLLELTWAGAHPLTLEDGHTRTFIEDYDTITMKGFCQNNDIRIGFGEVKSMLLPATATMK
ncbi:fumarylacetoacetase [Myroides sp. 1354]|uniref:fumarylacetoacetase n=1 Tax=unclassified Myroides TaxID=2642485 RepID=UPI002576B91F|nr:MULTISPECIES: fumarylacetoacetase [unclassified Myroides]MDM1046234.1 fumarylacetoacetase [Myroides sp. R163-1]MDM1057170.1 fumarylacetoacetase [Myroides sp. 1354]MDM1070365.1 fumarylacetoacetase [Myroides sp. 1372]